MTKEIKEKKRTGTEGKPDEEAYRREKIFCPRENPARREGY